MPIITSPERAPSTQGATGKINRQTPIRRAIKRKKKRIEEIKHLNNFL